jgi:hypothetical protein
MEQVRRVGPGYLRRAAPLATMAAKSVSSLFLFQTYEQGVGVFDKG